VRKLLATTTVFALGLVIGWTVAGRQSTVKAEEPVPPWQLIPKFPALGSAIPKFAPVSNHFSNNVSDANVLGPEVLRLDGASVIHNRWDGPGGVVFVYGGGAYELKDATIAGPVTLELDGAAANTASLLQLFGVIGPPPYTVTPPVSMAIPPPTTDKNTSVVKKTVVKRPGLRGDISSRYDGQK
jgi:hypothetical protein